MSGHAQILSLLARLSMTPRSIIDGDALMDLESRREPPLMALGHALDYPLTSSVVKSSACPHFALQMAQLESGFGS